MSDTQNSLMEIKQVDESIAIYNNASCLKITDAEQAKLMASFDENEIEIRPDGLIYLPQVFWRKRLNESFGIGQWAIVPKGSHKDPDPNKDKLYVQGALLVRGAFVAEAVGEAELHSSNQNQSWASVWESAKSDCITRCCKDLGIASELWQPQFIEGWKQRHAVQVFVDIKGTTKTQWRKKTYDPLWNEKGIVGHKTSNKAATTPATKKQQDIPSEDYKPEAAGKYGLSPDEIDMWRDTLGQCKDTIELGKLYKSEEEKIGKYPPIIGLFSARKQELLTQAKQPA